MVATSLEAVVGILSGVDDKNRERPIGAMPDSLFMIEFANS